MEVPLEMLNHPLSVESEQWNVFGKLLVFWLISDSTRSISFHISFSIQYIFTGIYVSFLIGTTKDNESWAAPSTHRINGKRVFATNIRVETFVEILHNGERQTLRCIARPPWSHNRLKGFQDKLPLTRIISLFDLFVIKFWRDGRRLCRCEQAALNAKKKKTPHLKSCIAKRHHCGADKTSQQCQALLPSWIVMLIRSSHSNEIENYMLFGI